MDINLFQNEDINKPIKCGDFMWTPLAIASKMGDWNMVLFVLLRGANVNLLMEDGTTAVHYAAAFGHIKVLELLIDRGANIHVYSTTSKTPLFQAVQRGHTDVVEQLLNKISMVEKDSFQAALSKGNWDILKLFFQKKYQLDEFVPYLHQFCGYSTYLLLLNNYSYLYKNENVSIDFKNLELLHYLVSGKRKIDLCHEPNEKTAVDLLIENGDLESIKEYEITNPIKSSDRFYCNRTALHQVVHCNQLNLFSYFFDRNEVEVNVYDKFYSTLLHSAAYHSNYDILFDIISHQSFNPELLEAKDSIDAMAIHISSSKGDKNCVELLLKSSTYSILNKKGKRGLTPLFCAVIGNHVDVVNYLLNQPNVKIDIKNDKGIDPLNFLIRKELENVKSNRDKGLKSDYSDILNSFFIYCYSQNSPKNLSLFANLPIFFSIERVNEFDHFGFTPLHYASMNGFKNIVSILIDFGSNILLPSCSFDRETPLSLAVSNDRFDVVKVFYNCHVKVQENDFNLASSTMKNFLLMLWPSISI
mmetsp:Transcript_10597/g.15519  ORF Transcript_10597/g.15519 Transcript_10597/m.15519 type:complete len:530 (-) Transcript_10597:188-1777(-)